MRKSVSLLLFAISFACISFNSLAQTTDSILARKFITLNASGKYAEAQSMFAPSLQSRVSADMLQKVWEQLEGRYGNYKNISSINQLKQDSLTIFMTICNFENAALTVALSFASSHSMYGFQIVGVQEIQSSVPLPNMTNIDTSVGVQEGRIYGTLLIPDSVKRMSVALIIPGSGPTDRNGNSGPMLQGNTYLMLADSLAVHGIASFRYDKRYVGKSMDFNVPVNDLRFNDYVNDAIALIRFLQADKQFSNIIVIGHSEGSLIGMLAVEKTKADAFISLAGAGEPIYKILQWQLSQQPALDQTRIEGILDSIREGIPVTQVPGTLQSVFRPSVQPYLTSLMKYDPAKEIKKQHIPILIVNGTTDIQVTVKQANILHEANPDACLAIIPGMNHILKNAPEDRVKNAATYTDPGLPSNKDLVEKIIGFIQSLP